MSDLEERFSKFCDEEIAKLKEKCTELGCGIGECDLPYKKCRECEIGKEIIKINVELSDVLGDWF